MANKYVSRFEMPNGEFVYVKDTEGRTQSNENYTQLNQSMTEGFEGLRSTDQQLWDAIALNRNLIATLRNSEELARRHFIFIGDSYNAGWTPEGTYPGWGQRAAAVLKKTLNASYWNKSIGGGGFGFADENEMSFYYQLKSLSDSMDSDTKARITDIVFGGGRNDAGKANVTVNAGIQSCANLIAENFPNARVWLFAIGWDGNATVREQLTQIYYESYSRAVDKGNWRYVEAYQLLQDKNYLASDRKHPNNDGNYLLGNSIGNVLNGSTIPSSTIILPFNYTGSVTVDGYAFRTQNFVNLHLKRKTIDIANGISHSIFTDSGYETSCRYLLGTSESIAVPFPVNAILTVHINDTDYFFETELECKIVIDSTDSSKNKMFFRHHCMNLEKTAYVLDGNITNIEFEEQQIMIPIQYA